VASILADIYWAGSLLPENLITLFTQSTAVLHKYLNDKLKILCLLQFFRVCTELPEFSMFREIPEYSRFSRFVATVPVTRTACSGHRSFADAGPQHQTPYQHCYTTTNFHSVTSYRCNCTTQPITSMFVTACL